MNVVSDERSGKKPKGSGAGESGSPPSVDDENLPVAGPESGSEEAAAGVDAAAAPAPALKAPTLTVAELQDRWLRAEADLRNHRRRAALEREETRRSAEDGVLLEMISMLDDLDRALEAAREAGAPETWTAGVRLTADRARERLGRYGVATLDPRGAPFDPRFHEALLEIDAPEDVSPGTIVQVAHLGYARGDRALRPARVVVARAPSGEG
jgi:molecular chaperone GrpE